VSGRGVGMDVVRTNIEKIGGTIELSSVAGKGTTFVIKIPLTLAIVSALIVECAGERFAIPQIGVVELVRAPARAASTRIERINGHAGAAPARPAAAAGQPAPPAEARRSRREAGASESAGKDVVGASSTLAKGADDKEVFIVVAQVGNYSSASSSTASSTPRRSW
jgi:two-component system, chemotaxis family, sensor kinase CheA